MGLNSIASILGVYDEPYASYSLGFYTMLAEIDYGKKNQYQYYYPGYVVPGFPKFDYKLRIGDVDYYNTANDVWLPFSELNPDELPALVIEKKITSLSNLMTAKGINHQIMYYPYLDKGFINYIDEHRELANPLFIKISDKKKNKNLAIEYNFERASYQLGSFIGFEHPIEGHPFYTSHHRYATFESCLIKSHTLFENNDINQFFNTLENYINQGS